MKTRLIAAAAFSLLLAAVPAASAKQASATFQTGFTLSSGAERIRSRPFPIDKERVTGIKPHAGAFVAGR